MLIEDVRNHVLPHRLHRDDPPFTVTVEPTDERAEALISAGLSDRLRFEITDSVADFVRNCAQRLLIYGIDLYEIVYELGTDGWAKGFRLSPIPPPTVRRRWRWWGRLRQHIPPDTAQVLGVPQTIELEPARLLLFRLPAALRQVRRTLDALAALSLPPVPGFYLDGLASGAPDNRFDVRVYEGTLRVALANATRSIGWDTHGTFDENMLPAYVVLRQLRFQRFLAGLRSIILATLNDGLRSIGEQLGFAARIRIEGLPTEQDIAEAELDLRKGRRPLREILRQFRGF